MLTPHQRLLVRRAKRLAHFPRNVDVEPGRFYTFNDDREVMLGYSAVFGVNSQRKHRREAFLEKYGKL